ncbi:MAG: hypothetical protein PHY03_00750, partial [Dehalococcoidia bacterium]|nr:hypothetical protein [Dehalococcoidia bacterium]
AGNRFLEVTALKKIGFISLSLLLLLVFIPGCITFQTPPTTTVPPVGTPPDIIVFSNNPSTIDAGGTSTLLWNVTGATSVSIDQGIGLVDVAGTSVVAPAASTVYTVSATNSAGTVTRSVVTTVNSAPPAIPFAVTSVIANTSPSTFTGPCPKTFTFYATIAVNGPGTVTYRWERSDGGYSDIQSITFYEAGAKTSTLQWDLSGPATGWHRIRVLSPYDAASNLVYYTLNCDGSLVTGVIVGVDQYPFTGPCPKTINFWGTIAANGPGTVTYRWERSDNTTAAAPESIIFAAAGSQTVTNLWTRGEGAGWQRLHVLTPNDMVSSQIDFVMTCWDQTQ